MGHASITTTEIYAHFVPRTDAATKGSAGLDAMLAPAGLTREGEIVGAQKLSQNPLRDRD
jgi:hypothetical protein